MKLLLIARMPLCSLEREAWQLLHQMQAMLQSYECMEAERVRSRCAVKRRRLSGGRTCRHLRAAAPRLCRGTLSPCPDLAPLRQRAPAGQLPGVSWQHAGPR